MIAGYFRNTILTFARRLGDRGNRATHLIFSIGSRQQKSTNVGEKSDSEGTSYVRAVEGFLSSPSRLNRFRNNFEYRQILEHVSYRQGVDYLDQIARLDPVLLSRMNEFIQNDCFGKPAKYSYAGGLLMSPTTVRYVAVAAHLRSIFGDSVIKTVAEIGVGYGGQCSVLSEVFLLTGYAMFDLDPVLILTSKYLKAVNPRASEIAVMSRLDNLKVPEGGWDLAISNYAFSELPKSLQLEYLEKVLSKSKRGYMIMNSGRSDFTGRSPGKMTLAELQENLPSSRVLEEVPQTGTDNYVLIWSV